MSEKSPEILTHVAFLFAKNREQILATWMKLTASAMANNEAVEPLRFKESLETFIDDFIRFIPAGNIPGYLAANRETAQSMAFNDLPFRDFIKVFHLFEESYAPLLKREIPLDRLIAYLNLLDYLHHETIAKVAEVYFEGQNSTVFTLVKFVELRDYETGGHLNRTTEYAVTLAAHYGVSAEFLDELCRVGSLHDIGKIAVRDAVLLKEGPLTDKEFDEMKLHTEKGAVMIDEIIGNRKVSRGYLLMARDIALHHHERYDGTGYPKGLKGEEIPLAARIFTVGDSYDAIVSKRPYKGPLPHEEAVRRIIAEAGKQFDPRVIESFIAVSDKFPEIFARTY